MADSDCGKNQTDKSDDEVWRRGSCVDMKDCKEIKDGEEITIRIQELQTRSGIAESDSEKIHAGKRGEEIFTKGSSEEKTDSIQELGTTQRTTPRRPINVQLNVPYLLNSSKSMQSTFRAISLEAV